MHTLPRGRHAAPREVVWESQRDRMLAAIAAAVAEKGYARTAVADVLERAGVSRKTFYEHFANKEACFLAAYDAGVELILGAIAAATAAAGDDLVARAREGTRTYLELLAANPDFARTFLVEVLGAGPEALARRTAVHVRFAQQMELAFVGAGRPDPYVFRACVGAIHELVTDRLLAEGAAALPTLLDELLQIQLRLVGGAGAPR
jgi:AcrR family transcriptional regulator